MAKATQIKQVVETPVGVTLELSMEEAQVLTFILGRGGGTMNGPRAHAQRVFDVLRTGGGVEWSPANPFETNGELVVSGSIQVESR